MKIASHVLIVTDSLASILYKRLALEENIVALDDYTAGDELTVVLGNSLLFGDQSNLINDIFKKAKSYNKIIFSPLSLNRLNATNLKHKISIGDRIELNVRDYRSLCFAKNAGLIAKNSHDLLLTRTYKGTIEKSSINKKCSIFHPHSLCETYALDGADRIKCDDLNSYDAVKDVLSTYDVIHTNHIELAMYAATVGNSVKLYKDHLGINFEIYKQSLYRFTNINISDEPIKINTTASEVSIVCACMNRADILNINIRSWLHFKEIAEIIIVDWSSEQSLGHLKNIDERIKIIRVCGEHYFNIAKAYNIAIDHATYPFILKMDVDYMLNPYYNFFAEHPKPDCGNFYAGDWTKNPDDNTLRYLAGCCYVSRSDIINVGGYNENFEGYGFDDGDLYNRLIRHGLVKYDLTYNHCILHVPHANAERSKHYKTKSLAQSGADNGKISNTGFTRKNYYVLSAEDRFKCVSYENPNLCI